MGRILLLPVAAAILLAIHGCGTGPGASQSQPGVPMVRVLLLEDRQRVELRANDTLTIQVGSFSRALRFTSGDVVPIFLADSGWTLGTLALPRGELTVEPSAGGWVSVNGTGYHGRVRFVGSGERQFDVINEVDIETYVKGVVALELLHNWHEEAYKAQAIAARTYALYELRARSRGKLFDLYADQRSQVYGGIKGESEVGRAAVDATRGIVVAYGPRGGERIFKAYFSACCGGITQSASDAFRDPPSQPLSDQSVGNRCAMSPHFNWGPVEISKVELARRVRTWGALHNEPERQLSDVARVDIQFINRFGRPVRYVITDGRGRRYSMLAEDFRVAFNTAANGGVTITSSFFKPVSGATSIRLVDGHGSGHGVGLCQWCAQTEALRGVRHETIVTSAYPGSVLVRAY